MRVQWTREQEHAWEPYGPAMMVKVSAALDDGGKIADWDYAVWSNTHSMRPGPAGSLIAARYLAEPFPEPEPKPIPMPEGGGDRNSNPIYKFPSMKVIHHFLPTMPMRVSALRSLGAYMNIFSIESFMDELAAAAGTDPVEFRLKHLDDPRAREVVSTAAERFGWSVKPRAKLQQNRRPVTVMALPLRATRISPPIARSPARSRSITKPAARGWCARSPPSIAARWSIPTASPIRSKAPSCNR